jgi:DNA-binding transcriptional LysR family regulator
MGAVDSVNDGCDLSIIVAQGDKIDGDFVANPLARTEILLCASPLYINNSKKILHPQDLSAHEVLVPPIAAIRRSVKFITTDAISETSAAVFFQPKEPAVSSLHLDAMYATALAGMGIVGLPSFMADDALRSGALIRVLHKWHVATLSVWVGVPSRRHLPIATRAFRDFLVEKFGTNPREDPWLALGGENSSPSSLSKNYQSVKLAVIPS